MWRKGSTAQYSPTHARVNKLGRDDPVTIAEHERVRAAYSRRPQSDPRYSWFNPSHVFTIQGRERATLRCLRRHGLEHLADKKILEIGCGEGFWLRELVKWGADSSRTHGMDLLQERVRFAKCRGPAHLPLVCGSGANLPYPDGTFDLVMQSTVFTSILSTEIRRRVAMEMIRVTRSGGAILWYDYFRNNPRNRDVKAVTATEVHELFPKCAIDLERVTLAPPLARARGTFLVGVCRPSGGHSPAPDALSGNNPTALSRVLPRKCQRRFLPWVSFCLGRRLGPRSIAPQKTN